MLLSSWLPEHLKVKSRKYVCFPRGSPLCGGCKSISSEYTEIVSFPYGVTQNLEPEKCEGWEWISWQQLLEWIKPGDEDSQKLLDAKKLFPPMSTLVKSRPGLLPQQALK